MDTVYLPISIAMGMISYGLIARWYVTPYLATLPREAALIPLILPHCFRYVGLAFLIDGVTSTALDPRFAEPAAYGDLVAAGLAIIAVVALRLDWAFAIPLVWIFNIEGTIDLFNALAQGLRFTAEGQLGATYFVPAAIVPALIVTHFLIFAALLSRARPTAAVADAVET